MENADIQPYPRERQVESPRVESKDHCIYKIPLADAKLCTELRTPAQDWIQEKVNSEEFEKKRRGMLSSKTLKTLENHEKPKTEVCITNTAGGYM